jgi:hypothetical protein
MLTEYKITIQTVLLFIDIMVYNSKQLQHARLSLHARCPSVIRFPEFAVKSFDCNKNSKL